MPSIRYNRDKRGYETTCVVHTYRGGNAGPTRILYLFRSPSHVTVGRSPLDDEAREGLEHTHPDVSFDWQGLGRELVQARDQGTRPWREREGRQHPRQEAPRPRPKPEDQSVLSRAVGSEQASRLRARYTELVQRVERRSRTPEERQELMGRLVRLNPDDWADEQAVRAGLPTLDAAWEAIRAALPQRRRGRRGGRRREEARDDESVEAGASAIMPDGGDVDEISEEREADRPDPDAGPSGDRNRLGTTTGDGLPGDD